MTGLYGLVERILRVWAPCRRPFCESRLRLADLLALNCWASRLTDVKALCVWMRRRFCGEAAFLACSLSSLPQRRSE